MPHSPAKLRVLKARENVALRDRWFAHVIYNVPVFETEATPTMDTNGLVIRFNPKWVMANDEGTNIEGVFCHEGWHVILNHMARQSGREPIDWNIACDAIINPMVLRRGWSLPAKHVRIKEVDDGRMSAERAYEWIRNKRDKAEREMLKAALKGADDGQQPDSTIRSPRAGTSDDDRDDLDLSPEGQGLPPEDDQDELDNLGSGSNQSSPIDDLPQLGSEPMQEPTPEEIEAAKEVIQRIERAVELATRQAVGNRSMDAEVLRNLKPEAPAQELDWREILREMAENNRNPDARTWSRPNRRYLGQGDIRPGYLKDKINRLIAVFDVSSSITSHIEKVKEMKANVANLLDEGIVSHVIVVSTDTDVLAEGEVQTSQEVIDFDLKIRNGGTHFRSVMDKIGQMEECVGCVFLTDMETGDFGRDPGFPVIWINWGNEVKPGHHYWPPYGRVIDYKPRG